MSKFRFCLIGDGAIAEYHKKAIEHVGGELLDMHVIDPKYRGYGFTSDLPEHFLFSKDATTFDNYTELLTHDEERMIGDEGGIHSKWIEKEPNFDYVVIASPSFFHRSQIQTILKISPKTQIICEKPAFMPWEPIIESKNINIVLQLRYLPNLPEKADLVKAVFVRDKEYFKTWKGDARKTGGIFYNLFIHFIDLAIQLGADFEGMVLSEGEQEKYVQYQSGVAKAKRYFPKSQWQYCYNKLYEDIIAGNGIKPKNLFYLSWVLSRNSELFGFGKNGIGKKIKIGNELL